MSSILDLRTRLRDLEVRTRPQDPDLVAALARRWDELPAHVRTREQMLGRRTAGCEGTHGVFPRCDLACTPCYHSREANRVRTDGEHTVAEVDAQMALLRDRRGPGQNAQLIGGEVTLLAPDDHAAALEAMRRHGRKPMSMSHGDFDYAYLEALALDPTTGEPRFEHLSFAGHFDSMMFGRRGIKRARTEAELNPYRERFCAMFERLEREHGVTHYLAHNMTVTPRNIDQVAGVIRDCRDMGFRMFSFQPAAFVGNTARWKDEYRAFSTDEVWAQIQEGAGGRLHADALHIGDQRCNRTAYGCYVGDRYVPLLDEDGDPPSEQDARRRPVATAPTAGRRRGRVDEPETERHEREAAGVRAEQHREGHRSGQEDEALAQARRRRPDRRGVAGRLRGAHVATIGSSSASRRFSSGSSTECCAQAGTSVPSSGWAIAYEHACRRSCVARISGSSESSPRWRPSHAGRTCRASMNACMT